MKINGLEVRKDQLFRRSKRILAFLIPVITLSAILLVIFGCGGGGGGNGGGNPPPGGAMVVLGYNDLGMHCINEDFSEICILPPANNLHAQVIARGENPQIITSGITVLYSIPSNTHSSDKTNFWTYAPALFNANLSNDVGLFGNGMSGSMVTTGNGDWWARGIPITPMNDQGIEDPYALSLITVKQLGNTVATTQAVVPVSWEISCNLCHTTPGISVATDILRKHDNLHSTTLESQKPVLCARCHADNALGTIGSPALPNLSRAMHSTHDSRMAAAGLSNPCYACHPGIRTQCLRDVHAAKGMNCISCHGDMANVGSSSRNPWVDEPRCGSCHNEPGHEYEQANTLYRESHGHHNVRCSSCHGSPHAITPTSVAADNVQAITLQGHAGPINTCTVCHTSTPKDGFNHSLSGGG